MFVQCCPHCWCCGCCCCRWVGVLTSYLLRPSAAMRQAQAAFRQQQGWQSPIVGVHIRRTDKIDAEAKLHQGWEYMQHAEHFCDMKLKSGWQQQDFRDTTGGKQPQQQQQDVKAGSQNASVAAAPQPVLQTPRCSVYLATDEPEVAQAIKKEYPHIHIILNQEGENTGEGAVQVGLANMVCMNRVDQSCTLSCVLHVSYLGWQLPALSRLMAEP